MCRLLGVVLQQYYFQHFFFTAHFIRTNVCVCVLLSGLVGTFLCFKAYPFYISPATVGANEKKHTHTHRTNDDDDDDGNH